ncbi:transcription factor IIIB 50 kDa subunit [Esox lucius]|uniref:Transcription factor IIIB 50 kDa subunit n=1 Tax=Esox lucius TaxID=8010 RepID=A0A3P8YXU8_ESOLU|nr:transcription factor IIIB 50 kDa subunit [Esox lucius]
MAAVGLKCPECGSLDIVDDEHYSQPQLVCADCGAVVSEGLLTTTRSEELQGTDVRYSNSTEVNKQPCRNQIKGIHRVRALCRILRLSFVMEETAENYFKQAYEHPSFIRVSLQKKEVLAGCCILATCRQHSWPITMGTMTCLLEANPKLMGVVYQEMVKALKIEAPPTSVIDLLETHCQAYKLSPQHVHEELSESSKDLTKRAAVLLELAADAWLVTGRQPVPILTASIYLAWQSLKPTQTRLKYTLARFCQMAKVAKSSIAPKRVTELKEVLCKLGQELPWLRGSEMTPQTVVQMVDDILNYRLTLLRKALKSHEAALASESELPPSLEDTQPGPRDDAPSLDATASQPDAESAQQPQQDVDLTCTVVMGGLSRAGSGQVSTPSKRSLFEPPSVTHAKIRRVQLPVKEVTGDEEISDSEIDSYIRTPQEMRDYAEAKEALSSSEEEF